MLVFLGNRRHHATGIQRHKTLVHLYANVNFTIPLTCLFLVQSLQSRFRDSAPHADSSQPLEMFPADFWCLLYVRVFNGDGVNAEQQAWYIANATHIAEHNAKSETFQLGSTQSNVLCQKECWTAAGAPEEHTTFCSCARGTTPSRVSRTNSTCS